MAVPTLGLIENLAGVACAHCHQVSALFGQGGGRALAEELGLELLGSLPLDPQIAALCETGASLAEGARHGAMGQCLGEIATRLRAGGEAEVRI